jgi:DNA-binding MarR family transcriptional regulator
MIDDQEPYSDAVFHHLLSLLRMQRRHAHRMREEQGISPLQFAILLFLLESGPARMSAVQAHIHHSPSSTSALVKQLEAKGLVTRARSQADNRVVMVALTAAGRHSAENTPIEGLPLLRRRMRTLPAERLAEIDAVIAELEQLMEEGGTK